MKPDLVFGVALALLVLGALAAGELRGRTDPLRVLLLGDSFAVGLARPLSAELRATDLTTYAREGEALEGFRRSHPDQLIPPGRWDVVLVSFGTNDFAAGPNTPARERFRASARSLGTEARARGARALWLLPPDLPTLPGANAWIAEQVADAGVRASPPPPAIERSPDRMHPTGRGYQVWARSVSERLTP